MTNPSARRSTDFVRPDVPWIIEPLMPEIWLRPNRRAIAVALLLPAVGMLLGLALWGLSDVSSLGLRRGGAALIGLSCASLLWGLFQLRRPRLARSGNEMLFYLTRGAPLRVPLEFVEGFLLGQGASYLPVDKPDRQQAATVVVRLADRATDFARRDVRQALGSWCNHYVTIRGTWCEPLSVPLVNRLNELLAAAQAEAKERRQP